MGALFLLRHGLPHRLDSLRTTGLFSAKGRVYRGLQPGTVKVYGPGAFVVAEPSSELRDIHDVAILGEDLFAVGTDQNVILRFSSTGDLLERWTIPGEKDCCHLNCIAAWGERIVYSCFGDFSTNRGYKGQTHERGVIRDLRSGENIIEGLSQPHSPIACGENLLVANSELHELREYDMGGQIVRSKVLGAYARGISVRDDVVFVGLSSPRPGNSSVDIDYSSQVVALDRATWEEIGRQQLSSPEIYSIVAFDAERDLDILVQIAVENECARLTEHDERIQLKSRMAALDQEKSASAHSHRAELLALTERMRTIEERLQRVLKSSSWRVTAPLRAIAAKLRALISADDNLSA